MKKSLQFLIDNICADFTVDSLLKLVRGCLAGGSATMSEITHAVMQKDGSLDVRSAEGLAEGTVEFLTEAGLVFVKGWSVYPAGASEVHQG